jgi:type I restriction enzyme, S subunit
VSFTESLDDIVSRETRYPVGKHATWERVRLGDAAQILNGFPFPSDLFTSESAGAFPLIRIRDLLKGSSETFYRGKVEPDFVVRSGDLLVGMDGDFNAAVWRGPEGLLNQRVAKITPNGRVLDARFVAYALPGYLKTINAHTSSITVKHLSSRTIGEIPLALPPLYEQRRIADGLDELLSDVDSGVAGLQRSRSKLKAYRASVLKAAVLGTLSATWREKHRDVESAAMLLERILSQRQGLQEKRKHFRSQDTGGQPRVKRRSRHTKPPSVDIRGLPTLPPSWCWATLGDISDIQGGLQKTPSRAPVQHHYPYLRVANVLRGRLDLRDVQRFELSAAELDRLRLRTGDLLIVEGNGSRTEIGRSAVWRGEVEDCVHQNHIIRVRVFADIAPSYVDTYVNSPIGQTAIQFVASSTSGLHTLSVGKIAELVLPMAPAEEQLAIQDIVEDQLSVVDHLESDIVAKLHAADALRLSILHRAFSGTLVPQDPNDEPASELLKRIATERAARQQTTAKAKPRKQPRKSTRR